MVIIVSVRVIISVRKLSHPHGTILPAMLFDIPFRSPTLLYDCNVTQSPRRESRAERTHAFIQIPRARQSSNRPAFSKAQQWIFGSGKRVLVLLVLIISSWCNWLLISQRDRLFEARLATIIFFLFGINVSFNRFCWPRREAGWTVRLRGIGLAQSYSFEVRIYSNRRTTLFAKSMQSTWSVTANNPV